MKIKYWLYGIVSFVGSFMACKKWVEVPPPSTQLTGSAVFANDASASSAIQGIYIRMMEGTLNLFNGGITLYAGMSSDELACFSSSTAYQEFYSNGLSPQNAIIRNNFWGQSYQYIYLANTVLAGLENNTTVTPALTKQLKGEARFIRALNYFYLVNFFGQVPLTVSTGYQANALLARSAETTVYAQVISDLRQAQDELGTDFSSGNGERTRPNRWAATALLAKAYLFAGDPVKAESAATEVIQQTALYHLQSDLSTVFLKNSQEAIWQLMPVIPGQNTAEGYIFNQASGIPQYAALSAGFMQSFESGDKRKAAWTNQYSAGSQVYHMPSKYKVRNDENVSEYNTVIRLADLYLLRASARLQQRNTTGAREDLDAIRNRAGLLNTPANTEPAIAFAIEQEYRVEFFAELADRWLELKRTGRLDAVMAPVKGVGWQTTDRLYPIPYTELQNAPNLVQNPGY